MIKKFSASALILLLLLCALVPAVPAAAEETAATPTDLDCPHLHTRTTCYFFDGPAYTSISSACHLVSGAATVETVCEDCGKVLSSEYVAVAEEVRPHSMKNGVCALCGYRGKTQAPREARTDVPGERTIYAEADAEDLLTITLSCDDLLALRNANVTTALVRGAAGDAAIALDVRETLLQLEATDSVLYMEMAEREDGSVFAGLYLVTGPGPRQEPDDAGITLRFYQPVRSEIRVSLAPVDADTLLNTEITWNERGYWSVPYTREGTYFLLR